MTARAARTAADRRGVAGHESATPAGRSPPGSGSIGDGKVKHIPAPPFTGTGPIHRNMS